MALVVKDRVQETSTTSGTGTLTLAGAVAGFQTFSSSIGNGNTTFYTIYDNVAQDWEVGVGTVGAGTLSRDTVLSNSLGTTAKISFASNAKSVFCTYPAEQSVNLDASGNVSPLGTISSGTWQGSTVGVAYGGTGVTASSGANSVVLRDANQNILVNSVTQAVTKVTSAAGTTTLTAASPHFQILTGTTTQTFKLPDATTLSNGSSWVFDNDSTGNLTVTDYASATVDVVAPGGYSTVFLESNATVGGEWGKFGMIPSEVNWGTNSLDMGGSTVITNGIWQGNTVGTAYGGTGLTGFGSANYALYSTSSSALTAGTLPVAAGGTAATTFTSNGVLYGNGTSALGVTAAGATGEVLVGNTGSAPSWGTLSSSAVTSFSAGTTGFTPSIATTGAITLAGTLATTNGGTGLTSFTSGGALYATSSSALTTGTLPIASGGTGQISASAAFNALSPITTTGDLILGNGTNSATRLPIGTNGYVLTSDGTTASWQASSGGVSTFQTSLSGLTPSTATSGAVTLAGTLGATSGGTGQSTYATGDILYASATNTLSKLTAGTNGYVLTLAGGVPSWAASTSSGVSFVVTDFTATAGQTTFTVTYTVGLVEVYRNGAKLAQADYTASNGTTIVLATPALAGDIIEVVAFGAVNTAAVITAEDFSGTGSQTVYTMSVTPANSASVIVAISGVVQDPTTYTVSGTTLTFSTAPPLGTNNISCRYLGLPTTTTGTGAVINATNGIIVNNQTISASYTIPVGSNAMSTGPVTAASGVTVTVSAGSRYIVI